MAANPNLRQIRTNENFNQILFGDNFELLKSIPSRSCRLIYIDPPFNTQKIQKRDRITVTQDDNGARGGFAGARYSVVRQISPQYVDQFDDFIAFIEPRMHEARRILTDDGSLFFHIDYREVHYVKVLLDQIFGRPSFKNELVWSYDYGGKPKNRWPAKHDNILWYAKDPENYIFNYDAIDRIPYMAPDLVGPEKAALGKVPTDVWWMTIVPTNSKEKTGYPTQKPLKLLNRIVQVHSRVGDTVLDFFAGSGTTGVAAANAQRKFILMDSSPDAIRVMSERLAFSSPIIVVQVPTSSFITNADLQRFVLVTDNVSKEYATQLEGWTDSPFAWILTLPSRARGAAGEKIVDKWLVSNGCTVARAAHTGCDRIVNGINMEIKFSTLWKSGGYTFQQLRDQDYASVFCLGISPHDVHAWVIPKAVAWKYATPQHGGSVGVDTKWLTFPASAPPAWLNEYGGTLTRALEVLKNHKR